MGDNLTFYASDDELVAWMEAKEEELGFSSRSEMMAEALRLLRKSTEDNPRYITAEIEDEDVASWIRMKYESGEFYNEEHVIQVALQRMKEDDKGQELV